MKTLKTFLVLTVVFAGLLFLGGCAAAEQDATDVGQTAVQGLSGQGQLSTEKVMQSDMGAGGFGNDFQ
jgi:hypothetical protein